MTRLYHGPDRPCDLCGSLDAQVYDRSTDTMYCERCYWDGPPPDEPDHPYDGDWRAWRERQYGGESIPK